MGISLGIGGTSVRKGHPQLFLVSDLTATCASSCIVGVTRCDGTDDTSATVSAETPANVPAAGKSGGSTPRALSAVSESISERASLAMYTICLVRMPLAETSRKIAPSMVTGK